VTTLGRNREFRPTKVWAMRTAGRWSTTQLSLAHQLHRWPSRLPLPSPCTPAMLGPIPSPFASGPGLVSSRLVSLRCDAMRYFLGPDGETNGIGHVLLHEPSALLTYSVDIQHSSSIGHHSSREVTGPTTTRKTRFSSQFPPLRGRPAIRSHHPALVARAMIWKPPPRCCVVRFRK
jgi:hypothetical protein